jgi:hypothetical protein
MVGDASGTIRVNIKLTEKDYSLFKSGQLFFNPDNVPLLNRRIVKECDIIPSLDKFVHLSLTLNSFSSDDIEFANNSKMPYSDVVQFIYDNYEVNKRV